MSVHIEPTIKALQGGLTELGVAKGVKNIDSWMEALESADFRGAKTIHENLAKLKKHLESGELDGKAIGGLLHTLGTETVHAAAHAEGHQAEKIKQIGELLTTSGGDLQK